MLPAAPTSSVRTWVGAIALAVAVVATGCSSSGGSDGSPPTTAATSSRSAAASTTSTTSTTAAGARARGVAADPSAGCGTTPDVGPVSDDAPGDVVRPFSSGGVDRSYRLAVPKAYDPDVATPLIFNLHGSGSNALQQSAYSDAPRRGAARGYLVVAPDAIDGKWQLQGTGTDADFLMALLDDLEARYCVDQNRVHIMGMSLGSWKAAATACQFSDRFASAVLVTVEVFPGRCAPMPVVAFHGTGDPVVPYGKGADPGVTVTGFNANLPGALDNMAGWARSGGCDRVPTVRAIGSDVVLRTWHGCDAGVGVRFYTVKGGGHTWSGSKVIIGKPSWTTHTVDATEIALDWFDAHPLRAG